MIYILKSSVHILAIIWCIGFYFFVYTKSRTLRQNFTMSTSLHVRDPVEIDDNIHSALSGNCGKAGKQTLVKQA